ncbi:hypothetical protein KW450_17060 [Vibrio fluvialis]|nr:hypothetical protein [Vibrio fluvialis]MBY8171084.1 hypothetical protein [Vibrio fluvialis]
MQISTYDVVKHGFILDENKNKLDAEKYKNRSSFDVDVGEILVKDDKGIISGHTSINKLEPQDSAYVISKQYIRVPEGFVAYVFLKNRMSQRGLLALNTGIIDQNYYGPISTLIINLSKESAAIPKNNTESELSFFRVVFHKIDSNSPIENMKLIFPEIETCKNYNRYVDYRKDELAALPKTFLNVEAIENRIKREVTEITEKLSLKKLMTWLAFIGTLLALVPAARDGIISWSFDLNKNSEQLFQNQYETKLLKLEISDLKNELSALKRQIDSDRQSNNLSSKPIFNQNLNITAPNDTDNEAVKKEVVDSLFYK